MDLAFQPYELCKFMYASVVSILVLMDLAFQLDGKSNTQKSAIGFNPCFNGSCFSTLYS